MIVTWTICGFTEPEIKDILERIAANMPVSNSEYQIAQRYLETVENK